MKHFGPGRSSSPLQYESQPVGPSWNMRTGGSSWTTHRAMAMRAAPSFTLQSQANVFNAFTNPHAPVNRGSRRSLRDLNGSPTRSTPSPGQGLSSTEDGFGASLLRSQRSQRSFGTWDDARSVGSRASLRSKKSQAQLSDTSASSRSWVAQRGQLSHKELMNGLCMGPAADRQEMTEGSVIQSPWNNRFIHGSPCSPSKGALRNQRWPYSAADFEDHAYVSPK